MRRFFSEVSPIEQLRSQFREYCIKLHPDKGGSHEEFVSMKAEYDEVLRRAAATEGGRACKENRQADFTYEGDRALAEAIERFLRMPGLVIEICGKWLWMSGNTFPIHDQLSAAGARWSKAKRKWYFSPYMSAGKCRARYKMDQIRAKFGSQVIESEAEPIRQLSIAF